jgi:hypothetical protein
MQKLTYVISVLAMLFVGLGVAWYEGLLADFYADYPVRVPLATRASTDRITVIAHQGDTRAAPENTLASFRKAMDAGMEYLEIDVRLTKDNVPVALHDSTLERTTNGEGKLSEKLYAEIEQLDAGSWFAKGYAGTKIPKLEEVLNEALGEACILIDLKDRPNYQLIKLLRGYADQFGPGCFLISIPEPLNSEAFIVENATAEQQQAFDSMVKATEQAHADFYRIFRRYWPDFPYAGKYRPGSNVDELFSKYPGMVVAKVSYLRVTRAEVEILHAKGLLTYTLVPVAERYDEERAAAIYTRQMESGVDLIFPGHPNGFLEFQRSYIATAKD